MRELSAIENIRSDYWTNKCRRIGNERTTWALCFADLGSFTVIRFSNRLKSLTQWEFLASSPITFSSLHWPSDQCSSVWFGGMAAWSVVEWHRLNVCSIQTTLINVRNKDSSSSILTISGSWRTGNAFWARLLLANSFPKFFCRVRTSRKVMEWLGMDSTWTPTYSCIGRIFWRPHDRLRFHRVSIRTLLEVLIQWTDIDRSFHRGRSNVHRPVPRRRVINHDLHR